MFKGWGSWLGIQDTTSSNTENTKLPVEVVEVEKIVQAQNEVNKQQTEQEPEQEPAPQQQPQEAGKGLSEYIFSFASSATKKISDSVSETAQNIKKSVEDGNIDGIIDKTILGDFQKEQQKFVEEKKAKKSDAAVPPWVGYSEEETIQQQILALSADRRNFLRDPPAGVQFHFDSEQMYPIAMVMLQEDELLNRMRFDLVPKHVKEEMFWRNYFYRVSLVKQSAQLTALAAQQQASEPRDTEDKEVAHPEDVSLTENIRPKTPPVSISDRSKTAEQHEEEEISTSPGVSEFVSDAFDTCDIDQEDLRKEMKQLVLDKKGETETPEGVTYKGDLGLSVSATYKEECSDWEKELQQELQEYEVVAESDNKDDKWDQEIEDMLQGDDS
ncbi:synapse-associated protein 1 isoform X1 [Hypomesus transpacificus]|uniref:synapse-associated protein 1 isoform X1 n=1 Tax=Hypomesus transpacificus TaxID=137520 RepID=UPI001F081142|nr:synapse-associated protein 1 isoform X1 [Hypomesus transpacificus]